MFELNYARSMLIQFTFFGAYFVMSLPAGFVWSRSSATSTAWSAVWLVARPRRAGLPARRRSAQSYELFLGALFVMASGITLLQVSANPYVSLLGDETQSSSRLTLAQALNSLDTRSGRRSADY